MHYVAIVDGQERPVEIQELEVGRYQVVLGNKSLRVDARAVSESSLSVIVDDEAYNIETERDPNGRGDNLLVRGHLVNVEVVDLRSMRVRKAQETLAGPDGPVEITAPMPGKVVEVLIEEGQEVDEGQGLIVVEAMKMENELRSPRSGVVRKLSVEAGAAVEGGVALCIVE